MTSAEVQRERFEHVRIKGQRSLFLFPCRFEKRTKPQNSQEKPMKRLDSRTSHLKEGGNDMNKVRNKPRKWRYKALYEDCCKFKEKKSSSRHSNIYSKGVSRHRKHESEDNKFRSDLRVNPQEEDIIRTKIGKMEIALMEHRLRAVGFGDLRRRLISGL